MKYLNKSFSVPGLKGEDWERIFGEKSNCCNAPMKVEGRTTHYYVCTKCQEACDSKPKE